MLLLDVTVRRDEVVLWILNLNCCQKRCMRKLSFDDIRHAEVQFNERQQTGKRNLVLEFLHNHSQINDSGEYETEFFVRGKSVCREAWLLAHNMNKETFRRILNKFKDGVLVLEHGNKGKGTVMPKTAECISWLQFFVNSIGDHQPNKGCIHLPSCFGRIDIYKKMMEENTALNLPTVSLSHFYNIWEKHFTHVLIPKENRFTKCTDCTKYKQEKERTMDKARRAEIDGLLKLHLELVWQERRAYYLHRYKTRKYPERYMTSIADGMDQHTTNVPKLIRISKAMSALATVGTHLVGCIVHSGQSAHGKEVYGSFDYYQFPHDANLTMTVLLDVLVYWTNNYLLPPILYLQFHNCVRENKNRYMFALLALLVEKKIFDKIRVNFLPVGHTHEDIDAFFGVFSKFLDKCDVYVVEDLLQALSSCMSNPSPQPYQMAVVYDIRSWVEDYAEELHAHTVPKCFKFKCNDAGKAEMYYRNWSHEEWQGPVIILKSVPTGQPKLVTPSLAKSDVDALRRDIPRYQHNMPKEASDTWEKWLHQLDELTFVPASYCCPIEKLAKSARTEPAPPTSLIAPDLLELRERETQQTQEIYTGRYRNPRERRDRVEVTDNFLEHLHAACFVAVFLENYDKMPVLGKVISVGETHFKIHYWKGSYGGKWSPQNIPRRRTEPWLEDLPKSCIVCCDFHLTEDNRLMPSTKTFLKNRYTVLRDNM
ncbi:uncharacterized protein LOC141886566 isoform X1 [Acropora palmata]|uniref:uncharacterized protein LOC141886566 isoform X1 n=2 Tax=Acropora palmata TaxID=6131 RepID=UPI003DA02083